MSSLIEKIEKSLLPECKVDISSFSGTALRRISEHMDTLNSQGCGQYKISSLYKNKNNRSEVIELTARNEKNETKGTSIII